MLGDNPVLDELDNLSPQAKSALQLAHATISGGQPAPASPAPASTPAPVVKPIAAPPVNRVPTLGPAPELPVSGPPVGAPPALSVNSAQGSPLISAALPKAPGYVSPLAANEQKDQTKLQHLRDSGSGIAQIHNRWARIPLQIADAVGSALFPGIAMSLPGTQFHHDLLVRQAENAVRNDETAAQNDAKLGQDRALTEEAEARADALRNPQPKEEESGKTITTHQGVMQWNPATQRYDIKAGDAPEKPEKTTATIRQDRDGNLWAVHPDGISVPVTANGQQLKGEVPEHAGNDFEQFYKDYLSDNKLTDTAHSRLAARAAYAAAGQAPQRPPQVTVIEPNGEGGGVVRTLHNGETVTPGAMTPTQMGSANVPTSATRTMAEAAPKVIEMSDRVLKLIDQQEKDLGPAKSRWNEFMAGKVGAPNAEFTKLRTDVGLLQTMLMRMHVGARGGEQIMQHFHDLIDVSKQDPENLRAALGEIRAYADEVAKSGKPGGAAASNGGGARTIRYQVGKRTYNLPADQEQEFLKDNPQAKKVQ